MSGNWSATFADSKNLTLVYDSFGTTKTQSFVRNTDVDSSGNYIFENTSGYKITVKVKETTNTTYYSVT